jgi:CRISPR-associated protein Cmr5
MNIDRDRAAHALQTITGLPADVKKYTSYVKGLPAAILQNGLGQAMAALLAASKGKPAMAERNGEHVVNEAHRLLYNHVQEWLCRDDALAPYRETEAIADDSTVLMTHITEGNEANYIRAQAEALAYLN